jgi:hypothetical protein
MSPADELLDRLPPPLEIHARMGWHYTQLDLLRRLLRLAQAANAERLRCAPYAAAAEKEGARAQA